LVRVLVVDDLYSWQQFIASALQSDPEYTVVGFASDGLEAIRLCQSLHPDLVLLDINLLNCGGLAAAEEIRSLLPHADIMFFSHETSVDLVQAALDLGARGFVAKSDGNYLLHAVKAVARGERYLSKAVVRQLRSTDSEQANNEQ
jgi:DNA-binding NarL/FixJ family response regulator